MSTREPDWTPVATAVGKARLDAEQEITSRGDFGDVDNSVLGMERTLGRLRDTLDSVSYADTLEEAERFVEKAQSLLGDLDSDLSMVREHSRDLKETWEEMEHWIRNLGIHTQKAAHTVHALGTEVLDGLIDEGESMALRGLILSAPALESVTVAKRALERERPVLALDLLTAPERRRAPDFEAKVFRACIDAAIRLAPRQFLYGYALRELVDFPAGAELTNDDMVALRDALLATGNMDSAARMAENSRVKERLEDGAAFRLPIFEHALETDPTRARSMMGGGFVGPDAPVTGALWSKMFGLLSESDQVISLYDFLARWPAPSDAYIRPEDLSTLLERADLKRGERAKLIAKLTPLVRGTADVNGPEREGRSR